MIKLSTINIIVLIVILTACVSGNPADYKENWSVKMADAAMYRFDSLIYYNNPSRVKWQYDIAMVGHAIDKLGNINERYSDYMLGFYNYFIGDDGSIKLYNKKDYNLDHVNPAKGLITLYKRTGEKKYLLAIESIVTHLKEQPRTDEGGYWHKNIYPHQTWLDGLYMYAPFLSQYAREFNQPQWYDEIVHQFTLVRKNTLDPKTGLLYHAHDASRTQRWANPETGQSKHFWGRAVGWYMMALVDVLEFFPEDHSGRKQLISILNELSESLLNVRDKETGLWYQVLDMGGHEGNYLEASCSNMFTYAFAKGAKKGFLPEKYLDIANQSFESIIKEFVRTDEHNMPVLIQSCGAAGLGGNPYRDGSYEYYITETIVENDPKGVGPFILAAIELGS
jgi:unsaturated rhamnogalacturonyl hydrolase